MCHCPQGEHLLHVLNTIGSRKVVLEAELKEIDDDIAQNTQMARKYGEEFFTEGNARLTQSRVSLPTLTLSSLVGGPHS